MRKRGWVLAAGLMLAGRPATAAPPAPDAAPAATAGPADAQLRALYDAEWKWRQAEFGRDDDDPGLPTDRYPHVDPASQQRRLAYWQHTLDQLNAISPAQLSPEERINAAVFRTVLENFLIEGRYRSWEMPFNADSQFWAGAEPQHGFRNAEEYRRYLHRLADLPRYFDEQTANMRAGIARGFTVPKATLNGREKSFDVYLVDDPAQNPFFKPFNDMPATISPADKAALTAEARTVIAGSVRPAYQKLRAFYLNDYLPKARTTVSAEAVPDGKAWYQSQIREYTTTAMTAEQIHALGLKEVARITADMEKTKAAAGFTGDLPAFLRYLKSDPKFYARTPDELLGVSSYVAKRTDGQMKNFFGFLPRYRFTIRPVPEAIAPFYTSGRGGLEACQMNTFDLASRPLYQTPVLTLHECEPGHSFQAAVALEQAAKPAFRQHTYFSGYGEGWGLYCEWLGTLMGIYRDPYEEFGRESYEMWRAARLVIDTGVHHYGWSRQQAIDYLAGHTALSQREVENEVDRYISWPGQALAYKLGELTIRRERAKAEQALGPKFDQRFFHDKFLSLGSVPLPTLEEELDRWIAAGGPDPYAGTPMAFKAAG